MKKKPLLIRKLQEACHQRKKPGQFQRRCPQTQEKIKAPDHFAAIRGQGKTNMFEGIDKSVDKSDGNAESPKTEISAKQ
jgi:hypothetical protein